MIITGSSSREDLNRSEPFWAQKCNPYRGMTPKREKTNERYSVIRREQINK